MKNSIMNSMMKDRRLRSSARHREGRMQIVDTTRKEQHRFISVGSGSCRFSANRGLGLDGIGSGKSRSS